MEPLLLSSVKAKVGGDKTHRILPKDDQFENFIIEKVEDSDHECVVSFGIDQNYQIPVQYPLISKILRMILCFAPFVIAGFIFSIPSSKYPVHPIICGSTCENSVTLTISITILAI